MKPGDIIVFMDGDTKTRATFHSAGPCRLRDLRPNEVYVTKDGQGIVVRRSDVLHAEPTQHGWLGLPQVSSAW